MYIVCCKTIGDVTRAKDEGIENVYPVNIDKAWKIAMTVFRWEGAGFTEEHREEGYMLSSIGSDTTLATFVVAWIEAIDKKHTKVTIVTKRKMSTNMLTTLPEITFHKHFAQAVDIIKAGKSLPDIPPD